MIKINDINYIENEGVNILTSPCIRNFLNAFSHMPSEFRDRYSLSPVQIFHFLKPGKS